MYDNCEKLVFDIFVEVLLIRLVSLGSENTNMPKKLAARTYTSVVSTQAMLLSHFLSFLKLRLTFLQEHWAHFFHLDLNRQLSICTRVIRGN